MIHDITDISGYLSTFGPTLAKKIQDQAEPLFEPGGKWAEKLLKLKRPPFQAQGDSIMGIIEVLKHQKAAMVAVSYTHLTLPTN